MNTLENLNTQNGSESKEVEQKAIPKKKKKVKIGSTSGLPRNMQRSAYWFVAILLIPAYYGIIKYLVTNINSILLAFSDGTPFVDPWSFRNFKVFWIELSADGGALKIALINTLKYYIVGVIRGIFCYIVAFFLYKKIPGSGFYRFIFFLPCIIPGVTTVAIFKNLIREMGPLWTLWKDLTGQMYREPLAYPETATRTMIIYMFLTGFGSTYLIYIGAMNRIPQEVLESAELDGCSEWRELWSILFPLTWGTFSTFFLMGMAGVFTSSGPILYFTNGAAKTSTLGFWLFNQVRGGFYNYPSAVGLVFTALTIPLVIGTRWLSKKLNSEVSY